MSVLFRNSQKAVNVPPGDVTALAEFVLAQENASEKEVSVLLVGDEEMSDLNARYRSRNTPTDVLAFPMHSGKEDGPEMALLGDVVVSAERAVEYAARHRLDLAEELSLYLVHGILHLIGYDDANPRDRKKMRRREKELMEEARREGLLLRLKGIGGPPGDGGPRATGQEVWGAKKH